MERSRRGNQDPGTDTGVGEGSVLPGRRSRRWVRDGWVDYGVEHLLNHLEGIF